MLEKKLLEQFRSLPEDKKIQVIDFVEFLKEKEQEKTERLMDKIILENETALMELAHEKDFN